jgi:hypothetical protein
LRDERKNQKSLDKKEKDKVNKNKIKSLESEL